MTWRDARDRLSRYSIDPEHARARPVLLHDGRAPGAGAGTGAIHDHYQNTVEPTTAQLDAIAEFQRTDARFFSSAALRKFAATGAPPELPPGITPAEKRGRTFLVDAPFSPPSKRGICALCHSGPMLNMVNQAHSTFAGGSPPVGARFINTGVTIVNAPNNPIRTWVVNDGINPVVTIDSPDLGCSSTPSRPSNHHRPSFPGPSLRSCSRSDALGRQGHRALLPRQRRQDAPRRRRSLSAVPSTSRRRRTRLVRGPGRFHQLTDNDVDDIVAYLKRLGPNRMDK